MIVRIKKYILLLLAVLGIHLAQAASDGIPPRPVPYMQVNNFSKEFPNYLSPQEQEALERKLDDFVLQTSNQMVVVIVDDLNGYEAWDYATHLIHDWQLGEAKLDNGIAVLVKPTGGAGERKVAIAVGYGLEGVIPDATAKEIVTNELIPALSENKPYQGLDKATTVLMDLAKKEYDFASYSKNRNPKNSWTRTIGFLILALLVIIIIIFRRGGGNGMTINRSGPFFWGGFGGGFWGGGGGGSWGGGSSGGGGGFGGFGGGGGDSGGGGASGSW